ncbi:hypothetical protein GCM10009122_14520 [Fulvivirga kasyanovii]
MELAGGSSGGVPGFTSSSEVHAANINVKANNKAPGCFNLFIMIGFDNKICAANTVLLLLQGFNKRYTKSIR